MTETRPQLPVTENSDARNEILASIRRNLAASLPFDVVRSRHHIQTNRAVTVPLVSSSPETLLAGFRENLQSVGGYCLTVSDESEARQAVADVIEQTKGQRVALSNAKIIGKLIDQKAGTEILEDPSTNELFDCDIGITSAQWAIAETGTLVLESERENHRLISLVPPVHLCVLRESSIRRSMGEILELTSRDLSRTITFITGASRTSDIELTLAIGVHGPRELHVIVIEDQ